MAAKSPKPSFLWQAVLILLPVAVLAVIGWASLRQDKVLAEHDARDRAQTLADQLVPTLWTELVISRGAESSNDVAFQVNEAGQLVFPPPRDSTPTPRPFSLTELSPEQARLWQLLQTVTTATLADTTAACRRFIESNPPERFAAAAQYQLGLLLLQHNNLTNAIEAFDLVVNRFPDALSESGLPLLPLAQFKIIEHEPPPLDPRYIWVGHGGNGEQNGAPPIVNPEFDLKHFIPLDSFCSNIVNHPSLLTPFLLGQTEGWVRPLPAGTRVTLTNDKGRLSDSTAQTNQWETVQKWQQVWEQHERSRELFAAAQEHFGADSSNPLLSIGTNKVESGLVAKPTIFWFTLKDRTAADQNWIAISTDDRTFICRPESELGARISKDTEHIPSYFGVGVELVGKRIVAGAPALEYWHDEYVAGGKGGGQYWEKMYSDKPSTNLLASAAQWKAGAEQLRVNVYLTSPDELFASQHSRAIWFGLLVITSTVAALIGLLTAWRAFLRQHRLAEMKSNFVSSVSHELRAPIASVRLMAESLERGKVNEPQKQNEYFRFIVQECRRLSSLIENVLDFSRIEQGRKQYEFEPTDLLALTRETVRLMEPYAEEKGVILKTSNIEHRTSNIEWEIDGRATQQALVNLIDNAIKHSPKGSVVKVGFESDDNLVRLWVEDNGAGIPPEEHQKIFEMFYRRGSELRRDTQGVGIGLSIVRHIVEAHGGRVTVRSNVGEGSRFTIELPRNQLNK